MSKNSTYQSFTKLFDENRVSHNFSASKTPQQNTSPGLWLDRFSFERKNLTLQAIASSILCENDLPKYFWVKAINTACYIMIRVLLRPFIGKTPFELIFGKVPIISYFKVFGYKCFILNTRDNLGKFDNRSDEGSFLGYFSNKKTYRVYNKQTLVIEEFVHVSFDESKIYKKDRQDSSDESPQNESTQEKHKNEKGKEDGRQ